MPTKKKTPQRGKCLCAILYPEDNPAHKQALDTLLKLYNCLAIHHNADTYLWDEVDEKGEVIHAQGELKKPHYHIIIRFENARYISGVAKELGIEENLIQKCTNFNSYVQYLTHMDEPLKHQYQVSDFIGTLVPNAIKVLESPMSEDEQVFEIQDYIESHNNITYGMLGRWCATYGYWSTFRRNQSYFKEIYYERKARKYNEKYGKE